MYRYAIGSPSKGLYIAGLVDGRRKVKAQKKITKSRQPMMAIEFDLVASMDKFGLEDVKNVRAEVHQKSQRSQRRLEQLLNRSALGTKRFAHRPVASIVMGTDTSTKKPYGSRGTDLSPQVPVSIAAAIIGKQPGDRRKVVVRSGPVLDRVAQDTQRAPASAQRNPQAGQPNRVHFDSVFDGTINSESESDDHGCSIVSNADRTDDHLLLNFGLRNHSAGSSPEKCSQVVHIVSPDAPEHKISRMADGSSAPVNGDVFEGSWHFNLGTLSSDLTGITPGRRKIKMRCHISRQDTAAAAAACVQQLHSDNPIHYVKAMLSCGHEVTWHRGRDIDPRLHAASCCIACASSQWRRYIDTIVPLHMASGGDDALRTVRNTVLSKLGALVSVSKVQDVTVDLESHIRARCRIAEAVLQNMTSAQPNIAVHSPPEWALLSEAAHENGNYRFVVCAAQASWIDSDQCEQEVLGRFIMSSKTRFGRGVKLSLLCEQSLHHLLRTSQHVDGSDTMDVCVGVVYSHASLHASEYFTQKPSDPLAQSVATEHHVTHCYDAVVYTPSATCATALEGPQLVTWEVGAAIPLAVVRITHSVRCIVCLDQHLLAEGYACPCSSQHFTCWDCLQQCYSAALKVSAIQGTLNGEGDLLCCAPQCRHPITLSALTVARPPERVVNAQQQLKLQVIKQREIAEALAMQKTLIEAEYARIEQIKNTDEKIATKLRLRIVNEVLTLKCPRCGMAFLDFDGCFAVTCANSGCRCSFCAWCLQDCGTDAHSHVAHCRESAAPGQLHATRQAFEAHHNKRKIAKTKALLDKEDLTIASKHMLKEMLVRDMYELRSLWP